MTLRGGSVCPSTAQGLTTMYAFAKKVSGRKRALGRSAQREWGEDYLAAEKELVPGLW